jgi:hypothetical protein
MLRLPPQVEALILPFINNLSRETLRKKLTKATPSIVARMERDQPRAKSQRHGIRYVLYWQCKSLVKSGELSDLLRDHIDDSIIAALLSKPEIETATDAEFAALVVEAVVRQVF